MYYTPELQNEIDRLNLKKENICYLTIQNEYLNDMRLGHKNVEYRDYTDYYVRRFFTKDTTGKYKAVKPFTHLLLQGGYNPDSPRMLIELKGIVLNKQKFPAELDTKGHELYSNTFNLLLGHIVYDSINYTLKQDQKQQDMKSHEKVDVKHPENLKPINLVEVEYGRTGKSKSTDELGMRECKQKLIKHDLHNTYF